MTTAPVACVPAAIPPGERQAHFMLAKQLLEGCCENRRALADGLEFTLPVDELGALARFIANERLCCPFVRFEITIEPAAGELRLRMTGPDGTRESIESELGLAGCGCR